MSKSNEYQKEIDYLAVGLTKSPTFMGINIRVFFGNVVISILICIHLSIFFGAIFFILMNLLAAKISIKEPNFLYIYSKAFIKTPPMLNRWYWGNTNSYEPW